VMRRPVLPSQNRRMATTIPRDGMKKHLGPRPAFR
jgi:hypothetical protein